MLYTLLVYLIPAFVLFFRGESAVHLASGARGSHGDIRHVELLLKHGSNLKKERTNDGCTAAHYAAESGTKEVRTVFCLLVIKSQRFCNFSLMQTVLSQKPP